MRSRMCRKIEEERFEVEFSIWWSGRVLRCFGLGSSVWEVWRLSGRRELGVAAGQGSVLVAGLD
jgi:hypothetical protein